MHNNIFTTDYIDSIKTLDNTLDLVPSKLSKLYELQQPIHKASEILPASHCHDVYFLIKSYIEHNKWVYANLLIDYQLSECTSPFIYAYNIEKWEDVLKNYFPPEMITLISTCKYFNDNVIHGYINSQLHKNIFRKRLESNEIDIKYSQLIIGKTLDLLGYSSRLLNNFYLLVFFDIFQTLTYFRSTKKFNDSISLLAMFSLHVLPLAMGIYRFGSHSNQLRDTAFYLLDTSLFSQVRSKIESSLPERPFIDKVNKFFSDLKKRFQTSFRIEERRKGVYSAYLKSIKYKTKVDNLWDLYAIRVILDTSDIDLCFDLLSEIESSFLKWNNEKGFYDYINKPKKNRYQSIHVILKSPIGKLLEIQIRTSLMHSIAEFGSASHQSYKTYNGANGIFSYDPEVDKGRKVLEHYLSENGLTVNDFIDHLKIALESIPLDHYLKGIAQNKYNPKHIIENIMSQRTKK